MTTPTHRLCVYCGSATGNRPDFAVAARNLGRRMAEQDIGLVYGGGALGLMGEVARAVLGNGGHVIGIIPEFLVSKERMQEGLSELIVTRTMHERKMAMFERSTGFVALPGGIGTLEELAEILTWAQLQQHARPIVLANVEGYWDPLLALLSEMRREGFIRVGFEVKLEVVDRAEDVIDAYRFRHAASKDLTPVEIIKEKF